MAGGGSVRAAARAILLLSEGGCTNKPPRAGGQAGNGPEADACPCSASAAAWLLGPVTVSRGAVTGGAAGTVGVTFIWLGAPPPVVTPFTARMATAGGGPSLLLLLLLLAGCAARPTGIDVAGGGFAGGSGGTTGIGGGGGDETAGVGRTPAIAWCSGDAPVAGLVIWGGLLGVAQGVVGWAVSRRRRAPGSDCGSRRSRTQAPWLPIWQ